MSAAGDNQPETTSRRQPVGDNQPETTRRRQPAGDNQLETTSQCIVERKSVIGFNFGFHERISISCKLRLLSCLVYHTIIDCYPSILNTLGAKKWRSHVKDCEGTFTSVLNTEASSLSGVWNIEAFYCIPTITGLVLLGHMFLGICKVVDVFEASFLRYTVPWADKIL